MKKNIISNLIHETMNKVSKCCGATIIDTEYDVNIHNSHKSFSYKMCSKCHSPQTESGEKCETCGQPKKDCQSVRNGTYESKILSQSPNSGEKGLTQNRREELKKAWQEYAFDTESFDVDWWANRIGDWWLKEINTLLDKELEKYKEEVIEKIEGKKVQFIHNKGVELKEEVVVNLINAQVDTIINLIK